MDKGPEPEPPDIEKKNPLKQGLKQNPIPQTNKNWWIEKKNPLKQGLKHNS